MSKEFNYTAVVQRFAAKFPLFTYLSTQIGFWLVANILLAIIMHLHAVAIGQTFKFLHESSLLANIIIAIILGIVYGLSLGLTDHFLDKKILKQKSLGKIILFKSIISLIVLLLLLEFVRVVLFNFLISAQLYKTYESSFTFSSKSWEYFFYLLAVYYFFMTIVINFINQVNKKYGPGILIPLLFGKYRNPREEERIFMFMDLQSSTSTAEKLGHLKYSSFIRDSFLDINTVLSPFNAEVYQYVGDEIVLTWRVNDGLRDFSCIRFFFACEKQFVERAPYYNKEYGFLPYFKAGLHMGKVTVVEIGEIKRDIAYHGDTLNTAARIQSVCNEHNKKFLVSEHLLEKIGLNQGLDTEPLGMIQLRGKTTSVGIASIDKFDNITL